MTDNKKKEPQFPEVPEKYRPWTGDSGKAGYPLGYTHRGHDVNQLIRKHIRGEAGEDASAERVRP